MTPAIYCLEPIGVDERFEATRTIWFCSVECRNTALSRVDSDGPYALGENGDYIDGTQCEECGKVLPGPLDIPEIDI